MIPCFGVENSRMTARPRGPERGASREARPPDPGSCEPQRRQLVIVNEWPAKGNDIASAWHHRIQRADRSGRQAQHPGGEVDADHGARALGGAREGPAQIAGATGHVQHPVVTGHACQLDRPTPPIVIATETGQRVDPFVGGSDGVEHGPHATGFVLDVVGLVQIPRVPDRLGIALGHDLVPVDRGRRWIPAGMRRPAMISNFLQPIPGGRPLSPILPAPRTHAGLPAAPEPAIHRGLLLRRESVPGHRRTRPFVPQGERRHTEHQRA